MRFEVGEYAGALRDAVSGLLAAECTPQVVRAGWPGGDPAAVREVWRKLAATGATGVLVPESAGGLGLDEDSVVPLLEAIGYSGLPVPAVETLLVAPPLLGTGPSDLLAAVLAGEAVVAVAPAGEEPAAFGATADVVLRWDGPRLRLYSPGELLIEPVDSIDGSRALARITPVTSGVALGDDPALAERIHQRGALGTSALLLGLSRRMLDMTVAYVKGREQFGVPIGSFQAIKHALASALLALEFARPAALAAGWSQAHSEPDAAIRTSLAKVLATDAARLVARTAVQCHGAIAYTTEYDLHLFAKRVWALGPSWGDADWHRDQLALELGV
jgi:alkylation response protein AidB-like acyl-CoA dehydrogenase